MSEQEQQENGHWKVNVDSNNNITSISWEEDE